MCSEVLQSNRAFSSKKNLGFEVLEFFEVNNILIIRYILTAEVYIYQCGGGGGVVLM